MNPGSRLQARRRQDFSGRLRELGWYHSFAFPDGSEVEGVQSVEYQHERFNRFPLPSSLEGKTVLDIGAWDGWFSFEAERRGARVTAVDCVDIPNFRLAHKKLGSSVDYRILTLYDLPSAGLARFDVVFFLGVLYHLKHPLRALDIVCSLTN
jgi:tRNA (mo5U34)-methyltransferase